MNSTDYLLVVFHLAIVAISIVIYSIYDKAKKYVAVCIMERYIAYGDDSLTLRLVSKLPDLRVANAKWIQ